MIEALRILVVDDEPANMLLLQALLRGWGYTAVEGTTDARTVVARFEAEPPDLLLLDLQMPAPDGFEVLARLAPWMDGTLPVPVLVLTADPGQEVRRRALAEGARDFVTKPFDPEEVRLRVRNLLEMRALQLRHAATEMALEARVRERTAELEATRLEALHRLALAAEFRDDRTGEHIRRVGSTSRRLAQEVGMSAEAVERLEIAARLHDVGKLAVSDAILLKQGDLTGDELALMQGHTVAGGRLLRGSGSELLQAAERIALTHHERWDGSGYPHGLSGDEIPLPGRIVALADVFDALTHERPYRAAWPVERALEELASERGRHFDPELTDAFLALDHAALPHR